MVSESLAKLGGGIGKLCTSQIKGVTLTIL